MNPCCVLRAETDTVGTEDIEALVHKDISWEIRLTKNRSEQKEMTPKFSGAPYASNLLLGPESFNLSLNLHIIKIYLFYLHKIVQI